MANDFVGAGALSHRVEILSLRQAGTTYTWEVERRSWAKAELLARRSNFSVHGVGCAGVCFTLRRQELDLGYAIRWRGRHCHITAILPLGRNHLTVEAALVTPVRCRAAGEMTGGMTELNRPTLSPGEDLRFPAAVTEKYQRTEDREVHDTVETALILTVPKPVPLLPVGRLVTMDGAAAGTYEILTVHPLDIWHNAYEIVRRADA